jgi:phosphoglycolate phosphatase
MSAPLRLVVFDVDGTLVDSQHHIIAAMNRAFQSRELAPPSDSAILSIVGLSLPEAMAQLASDQTEAVQSDLVAAYRQGFFDLRQEGAELAAPSLYAGARLALERLNARPEILLAVATGKSRRGLSHLLAAHGLGPFFATTQVADDHPSKPHPAMLLAALAETGTAARDGVMVGDTEYDIEMGRAAGLATIGVTWGYHSPDRLRAAGADVLIDHFAALPDALAGLWGE